MNGPGLPKFGSSPVTSMPTSNPAPTTMSFQSNPSMEMTYEEIQKQI